MAWIITIGNGTSPAVIGGVTVPNPYLYRVERAISGGVPQPVTIQNLGRGPSVTGAPAGAPLAYFVDGGASGTITVGSSQTLTPPLWLDSTPGVTVVQLSGGQFG